MVEVAAAVGAVAVAEVSLAVTNINYELLLIKVPNNR